MVSKAQMRATTKYRRNNYKQVVARLKLKEDKDMIEWLMTEDAPPVTDIFRRGCYEIMKERGVWNG
jgi:hypothetical protein